MQQQLRVLGRIRLSRDADETGTSVERQREAIEQWSAMHGHTVIAWAVDSGVSGSVDPFETPEMGPWLTPVEIGFEVPSAVPDPAVIHKSQLACD